MVVRIVDLCAGCERNVPHIDLSKAAFLKLYPFDVGYVLRVVGPADRLQARRWHRRRAAGVRLRLAAIQRAGCGPLRSFVFQVVCSAWAWADAISAAVAIDRVYIREKSISF